MFVIISVSIIFSVVFSPNVLADEIFEDNIMVNDDLTNATQIKPSMALGVNGEIYIVWCDSRNGGNFYDVFFAKSVDNGETFGTNMKISGNMNMSFFNEPHVSIAIGDDGSINVVWVTDINGTPDICFTKSIDQGNSWESPEILNDNTSNDHRTPNIVNGKENSLYVIWVSLNWTGGASTNLMFASSVDGGATWTEKAINDKDADLPYDFGNPSIAVASTGQIYVTYHYKTSIILSQNSDDGGISWSSSVLVNDDLPTQLRASPSIVCFEDKIFIAWEEQNRHMNDIDRLSGIFISISSDCGLTWSSDILVNNESSIPSSQDTAHVFVDVDTNGNPLIFWSGKDVDFLGDSIYFTYSGDGGYSWSNDFKINTMDTKNVGFSGGGYPTASVELNTNTLYVSWDDLRNDQKDIFSSSLRMPSPISLSFTFNQSSSIGKIFWTECTHPSFRSYDIYASNLSIDNSNIGTLIQSINNSQVVEFNVTELLADGMTFYKVTVKYTNGLSVDSNTVEFESEIPLEPPIIENHILLIIIGGLCIFLALIYIKKVKQKRKEE